MYGITQILLFTGDETLTFHCQLCRGCRWAQYPISWNTGIVAGILWDEIRDEKGPIHQNLYSSLQGPKAQEQKKLNILM